MPRTIFVELKIFKHRVNYRAASSHVNPPKSVFYDRMSNRGMTIRRIALSRTTPSCTFMQLNDGKCPTVLSYNHAIRPEERGAYCVTLIFSSDTVKGKAGRASMLRPVQAVVHSLSFVITD